MNNSVGKIYYVAYSWNISGNLIQLCVGYSRESQTKQAHSSSKNEEHFFCYSQKVKVDNAIPPDMGTSATRGISGLHAISEKSRSPLDIEENYWHQQIEVIDSAFERILADLMLNIIQTKIINSDNDTANTQKSTLADNKKINYIIVQGPPFPKFLGRMLYRDNYNGETYQLVFATFRRRFLTPNPFSNMDETELKRGKKYGPCPDLNKEALLRQFYFLPHSKAINNNDTTFMPIRFDFLHHNQMNLFKPDEIVEPLFEHLSIKKLELANTKKFGYDFEFIDKRKWVEHPDVGLETHRVAVPYALYQLNKQSQNVLCEQFKINTTKKIISYEKMLKIMKIPGNDMKINRLLVAAKNGQDEDFYTEFGNLDNE